MVTSTKWRLSNLIRDAYRGNYQLFEEHFTEICPWLTNLVKAMFPSLDWMEAESVAQNTMYKVLIQGETNYYKGTTDAEAESWLLTIARNYVLRSIEVAKKYSEIDERAPAPEEDEDELGELARKVDWEWVKGELSTRQREALELYLHGFTNSEIANKMGVDPSRVSQLLNKAKYQVRRFLYTRGLIRENVE